MPWRRVFETIAISSDLYNTAHLERKCGFVDGHLRKARLGIDTLEHVAAVTGWTLSEIVALYELERDRPAVELVAVTEEEEENVRMASVAS